jgi:transposase
LDECGIEHRLYREYARSPRGERVYESISGNAHKRTSIISACRGGRLIEPMLFEGACTPDVVNAYFEQMLLPVLRKGSIIVLDNARFHQSATTRELVKGFGCELLFLPAYSPDLNPTEHIWATLKRLLRPKLSFLKNKVSFIAKTSLCLC